MIADRLERLALYLPHQIENTISDFLRDLSSNSADGYYPISGEQVFARVMTYETKPPELCKVEAHNKYIDIQATLVGAESIAVFPRDDLMSIVPYSATDDVEFFEAGSIPFSAETRNYAGCFTLLYPHEAHRPMQAVTGYPWVKKFVIKVAVDL
jgi:YhcH/YjgK/YiaL family protein